MRATNISEVISVAATVAETCSYHARSARKVRHCAIFLGDSSGRPASGPFPAGNCRIGPSARVRDTRVKPKFVRDPRGGGLAATAMTGAAGYVPSNSVLRRCTTSRIGGAPNSRLYSRLNCDALS